MAKAETAQEQPNTLQSILNAVDTAISANEPGSANQWANAYATLIKAQHESEVSQWNMFIAQQEWNAKVAQMQAQQTAAEPTEVEANA